MHYGVYFLKKVELDLFALFKWMNNLAQFISSISMTYNHIQPHGHILKINMICRLITINTNHKKSSKEATATSAEAPHAKCVNINAGLN